MNAAISPLWSQDDPLFDLNSPLCAVPSHPDGACPVAGLAAIVEELEMLAMAASVRRDARLAVGDHGWEIVAEDDDVRVVIPA